jgi:hypothetical protein
MLFAVLEYLPYRSLIAFIQTCRCAYLLTSVHGASATLDGLAFRLWLAAGLQAKREWLGGGVQVMDVPERPIGPGRVRAVLYRTIYAATRILYSEGIGFVNYCRAQYPGQSACAIVGAGCTVLRRLCPRFACTQTRLHGAHILEHVEKCKSNQQASRSDGCLARIRASGVCKQAIYGPDDMFHCPFEGCSARFKTFKKNCVRQDHVLSVHFKLKHEQSDEFRAKKAAQRRESRRRRREQLEAENSLTDRGDDEEDEDDDGGEDDGLSFRSSKSARSLESAGEEEEEEDEESAAKRTRMASLMQVGPLSPPGPHQLFPQHW